MQFGIENKEFIIINNRHNLKNNIKFYAGHKLSEYSHISSKRKKMISKNEILDYLKKNILI